VRVAAVGGAGFIGRHLVRRLIDAGHDVVTIDLRAPADPLPGEILVQRDLLAEDGPESAAASSGSPQAVAWLAASIRHHGVDETAAEDVRLMVEAPLRFLAALRPSPSAIVYLSSIQVYGAPRRLPVDEDHPTDPFTAYGVAKLCAEQYLKIWSRGRGASMAALRVAFAYGPGQHPTNAIPHFIESLRRGEPPVVLGDGRGVRDDIYVGDVARAVEIAIAHRADGVFNIASGRPHTLLQVAETVCRAGGSSIRPRLDPTPSGWIDRWFEVDRARRLLAFEAATPFDEGIRAMWGAAGDP